MQNVLTFDTFEEHNPGFRSVVNLMEYFETSRRNVAVSVVSVSNLKSVYDSMFSSTKVRRLIIFIKGVYESTEFFGDRSGPMFFPQFMEIGSIETVGEVSSFLFSASLVLIGEIFKGYQESLRLMQQILDLTDLSLSGTESLWLDIKYC
ncbi:hypothetical protein M0804_011749 [Polistes exclamans]|nr:hypothetical protein M0804_011749 [Polistes exclamans]